MTANNKNSHVLPEIGVTEFNGGVRIWIGSTQIAVSGTFCARAVKYGKNERIARSVVMLPKFAIK